MTISDPQNILDVSSRSEFRNWLLEHAATEPECWVFSKRGKPKTEDTAAGAGVQSAAVKRSGTTDKTQSGNAQKDEERLYYLDAVEEALCFGWIDSTFKKIDGRSMQRFSPRQKTSKWTELNKERVRRLEKLGLMTDLGRAVLPNMDINNFKIDADVEAELKKAKALSQFKEFPALYQRIKAYNVAFYKKKDKKAYERMLERLIEETKAGNMYGEWNDYGRLLDY